MAKLKPKGITSPGPGTLDRCACTTDAQRVHNGAQLMHNGCTTESVDAPYPMALKEDSLISEEHPLISESCRFTARRRLLQDNTSSIAYIAYIVYIAYTAYMGFARPGPLGGIYPPLFYSTASRLPVVPLKKCGFVQP